MPCASGRRRSRSPSRWGRCRRKRSREKNHGYRTLGLGYANLGTLLMRMGLPYDSEEGFGWCAAINALMTGTAYRTSAEMAQQARRLRALRGKPRADAARHSQSSSRRLCRAIRANTKDSR